MGAIVDPDADARELDEERRARLWCTSQKAMYEAKRSRDLALAGDAPARNHLLEVCGPLVESGYTVEGAIFDSCDWMFPVQGN